MTDTPQPQILFGLPKEERDKLIAQLTEGCYQLPPGTNVTAFYQKIMTDGLLQVQQVVSPLLNGAVDQVNRATGVLMATLKAATSELSILRELEYECHNNSLTAERLSDILQRLKQFRIDQLPPELKVDNGTQPGTAEQPVA